MLKDLLGKLQLNKDEVQVLDYLFRNGTSSVLEIARGVSINRTTLYRILDRLAQQGFVVKGLRGKTTVYDALSVDALEKQVFDYFHQGQEALEVFEAKRDELFQLAATARNPAQVRFYNGGEECRQLLWNSLQGKTVKSFGYKTLREVVGAEFFADWWKEVFKRDRRHYLLINPDSWQSKKQGDSGKRLSLNKSNLNDSQNLQVRLIAATQLKINVETFIYNDVYSILQWHGSDIFGVEIQNETIARQEEAVFDLLWQQGEPLVV